MPRIVRGALLQATVAGVLANRRARPEKYAKKAWAKTKNAASRKSLASATMIVLIAPAS